MVIYELFTGERDEPFPDTRATAGLFCPRCRGVRRDLYPRPVDMRLKGIRPRLNIGIPNFRSIGLIHQRLLDRIGEYMTDFAFGDVYDMEGHRLPQYRTFYSARFIRARRTAESEIWQCPVCQETSCGDEGERYFLKHEIGSRHVFHDHLCYTYVDEWLAGRIDWSEFKDFELLPFAVLDCAISGLRLPGDPDWSDMGPPLDEAEAKRLIREAEATAAPLAAVSAPARRPPSRTRPAARLKKSLRDRGLNTEEVAFLMGLARAGFKIVPASSIVRPLSAVALGASHLGGLPDLPSGLEWPRCPDARPMAFLAQLNLADATGVRLETPLPRKGQLYFFYDVEKQPWGLNPADAGHWRVLLAEAGEADLRRAEPPAGLPPEHRFDVREVRLEPTLFLPSAETLAETLSERSDTPAEAGSLRMSVTLGSYAEWVSEVHDVAEGEMDCRLLGHPSEAQSEMPGDLISTTASRSTGESAGLAEPSQAPPQGTPIPASEWRLLLQLDTTGGPGWMWGDSGRLYFWVLRAGLQARRLQSVWVVLQST
jgi:uncharacterized protein YwqG